MILQPGQITPRAIILKRPSLSRAVGIQHLGLNDKSKSLILSNIYLLLSISFGTGVGALLGSLIGSQLGALRWFFGFLIGGGLGIFVTVEIATRYQLTEVKRSNAVIRFSFVGLLAG